MPSKPPSVYRWGLRAVVALQCLLICAFVYRYMAAPAPQGPRLPAVQGATLWLESHGALHQFDTQGQRLQRIELSALQLSPNPTSLQFKQAHIFWVHDASRVHRCDLSQKRCMALDLPELSGRSDYRWVRVSSDESEVVVSDASGHQVLVYQRNSADGKYLLQRTYADGMRFPNQTLQTPDGMWVANTNQHQIVRLLSGPSGTQPARSEHPITHPDLRPTRRFPFAMARDPQERLWVLVADGGMRNADLLRMNQQAQPERVIPIAQQQDPNAIVFFDQHLLLTDMRNFVVQRLDLQGQVLAPFGDAPFRAELAAAHQQYRALGRLPTLLISSICVLMLAALWFAWKSGELGQLRGAAWRKPAPQPSATGTAPPPVASATPLPPGRITTVKALPGSTRTTRHAVVVGGVLMCAVMATISYELWPYATQFPWMSGKPSILFSAALLLPLVALPPLLMAQGWRQLKALESIRIGTDGVRIQAQVGKRRYQALADQVTCTRQHLLIGTAMVPLRHRGSALFDEGALRQNIIDRLPQMTMHDSIWHNGLITHYWRHGGWRGRCTVVGMAVLLGLTLWVPFALR